MCVVSALKTVKNLPKMVEDHNEPGTQHVELICKKHLTNGTANSTKDQLKQVEESMEPPDGGTRAWLVMVASFFCNGILFGVINSYGVIYEELYANLQMQNVSNAAGKAGEERIPIKRRPVENLRLGTRLRVEKPLGSIDFRLNYKPPCH